MNETNPFFRDDPENPQNTYRQTVSELKRAEYFWDKDRIIRPNAFRILFLGISALVIATCVWYVCSSIVPDGLISTVITLAVFVTLSILLQPQIYQRILARMFNLDPSMICHADLMKNMDSFFYKDATGTLHDDVLYVAHDGHLSAFSLFKIDTIPLGIRGEFKHFIRSIYGQKIPLFWNYIQAPVTEKEVTKLKNVSLDTRYRLVNMRESERDGYLLNLDGVWEARIIFGTSASKKTGINASSSIQQLYDDITKNIQKLEAAFYVNFPHSKIVLLKGKGVISAIHAQLTNGGQFRFF